MMQHTHIEKSETSITNVRQIFSTNLETRWTFEILKVFLVSAKRQRNFGHSQLYPQACATEAPVMANIDEHC